MVEFVHHYARLNGLDYHFVTAGKGPAVLLLHGFPDLWIGWQPVMKTLVAAGYFVVAPDMRGFGETEAAQETESATGIDVMGDLVALLDHLGIKRAAVIAHDWGAEVGWTITRLRPDRFGAIVALSVPYAPRGPVSLTQMLAATAPPDLYMLYFLEKGRAEIELDADPATFLRRLFYTSWGGRATEALPSMRLAANGRLIDGLDEPPSVGDFPGADNLAVYTASFVRTGFRGALNTYRSLHRNWELLGGWADRIVEVPALYIGGSRDIVFHFPRMRDLVQAMPALLPKGEVPVILDGVGHFIQIEQPDETSRLAIEFLTRHHPDPVETKGG